MAKEQREHRDGGQRSVVYALLVIAALAVVSVAVLALTNGDSPKEIDRSKVVASSTPAPTEGPLHDQLLAQCDGVRAALKPIADFLVTGVASIPAGAPKPVGTEQVTCALGTNGGTSTFVASRFVGASADSIGAAIESAGWAKDHAEVNGGLAETLYTRSGEIQIAVVDIGGGQVVVVYS